MRQSFFILAAAIFLISTSVNIFADTQISLRQDGRTQAAATQKDGVQTADAGQGTAGQVVGQSSKEYILGLVNPVEIEAIINKNCRLYTDQTLKKYSMTLSKGEEVKFLRDKDKKLAYVRLEDGTVGWVGYSYLSISNTSNPGVEPMTDLQKCLYVNYKDYESDTKYLVWVNIQREQVNVFLGAKEKWTFLKTIVCSSGTRDTPSLNGEFKYSQLYRRRDLKGCYVYNFMRFYDTFAIHSIPFNYNNTVSDATLGSPRSEGCIRVAVADSAWLVKYIPIETTIIIN